MDYGLWIIYYIIRPRRFADWTQMCNFCGLERPSYQSDFQSAKRSRGSNPKKIEPKNVVYE
jgi:hypothetical protein